MERSQGWLPVQPGAWDYLVPSAPSLPAKAPHLLAKDGHSSIYPQPIGKMEALLPALPLTPLSLSRVYLIHL